MSRREASRTVARKGANYAQSHGGDGGESPQASPDADKGPDVARRGIPDGSSLATSLPVAALALTLGALALFRLPDLPSVGTAAWLALVLLLALRVPWMRPLAFLALGFALAWAVADARRAAWLPHVLEGRTLVVSGVVEALPQGDSGRLDFRIERMQDVAGCPACGRVRLSWRDAPVVRLGERWRLAVRLKAPRGFSNPHIFDYERWLFQRGHVATGYVREREQVPERLAASGDAGGDRGEGMATRLASRLATWRQTVIERVRGALGEGALAGVVIALAAGERAGIGEAEWSTFRATGTGHLVAISGLHVGLVAGLAFLLVRKLAGAWNLWWPAPRIAALAAIAAATGYAALAGFSLPTQRALIMLIAVMAGPLAGRGFAPLHGVSLALLVVVMLDPPAVLAPGFWLSFGAVGVILFIAGGRAGLPAWWRWGRVHLLVAVGLMPLGLLWFAQASLVAPLANLLAVPWVSLAVVPLILIGVVLGTLPGTWATPVADWALREGHANLAGLWPVLDVMAAWPVASWQPFFHVVALPLAMLAFALLAAPRGWPGRWLVLPLLLPLLWPMRAPRPEPGAFELTVLDVGQGLSAVVRTANHTLLYDTGPRFRSGFDTGERIVLPYLRALGVETLDLLLVSHGDSDHRGGLEGVLSGLRARRLISGEPDRVPGAGRCEAGLNWRWDGVEFRVLGPPPGHRLHGNDASCVLRVATAAEALILTADLESAGEAALLRADPGALRAAVLQVPHHGSETSSHPAFVAATRPRIALVTSGYRNPFRLPRESVLTRYRALGARIRDTRVDGALTLHFPADAPAYVAHAQRVDGRRVWTAR